MTPYDAWKLTEPPDLAAPIECRACNGQGYFLAGPCEAELYEEDCDVCWGTGVVEDDEHPREPVRDPDDLEDDRD